MRKNHVDAKKFNSQNSMNEKIDAEKVDIVAPVLRKRVLIIDDELAGLKFSHLQPTVEVILGDLTSPQVGEIWAFASGKFGFKSLEEAEPQIIRDFLASESLVNDVILSSDFLGQAGEQLQQDLAIFLTQANSVNALRSQIIAAFPEDKFEVIFRRDRPNDIEELMVFDLLIFDLVLEGSGPAIKDLVNYLARLGSDTYPRQIPCVIVMSNYEGLLESQVKFSAGAQISAAGLMILAKREMTRTEFGALGLNLSYQQLDRQREVAQQMRVFMRTWTSALDSAKERAAESMWNLDAAAMQEFHLVAYNDHDPYDEYLNALMAREYSWQVESDIAVAQAIENLDKCFKSQFNNLNSTEGVIKKRFIAPFVQPKHGRDLVSHYTWTGMPRSQKITDLSNTSILRQFNKHMPFGAVLMPTLLTPNSDCFVHITQQCDLNQSIDGKTVQFAVVRAVLVKEHAFDTHDKKLVARGLWVDGKEYDLVLKEGRQLALPKGMFIRIAKQRGYSVVGRLRHDIAAHFLIATTNNMTRWAAQKVEHVSVQSIQLYLHGENFPDGHLIFTEDDGKSPFFYLARKGKINYFQDSTSIRIAIWIAQQLEKYYPDKPILMDIICNQLSVGVSPGACIAGYLHLQSKELPVKGRVAELSIAKAKIKPGKVSLMCISEPKTI